MEKRMNLKLVTAAAVLSTAIAAPALAQDPPARATSVRYQQDQARIYHRNTGFWPGDVAAGVVGGAIGTAGAIATAPFRNDTYAYYGGYYGNSPYAYRNGFVCQPGTTFRGEDGRRHICQ
jgi:hypothetical protein